MYPLVEYFSARLPGSELDEQTAMILVFVSGFVSQPPEENCLVIAGNKKTETHKILSIRVRVVGNPGSRIKIPQNHKSPSAKATITTIRLNQPKRHQLKSALNKFSAHFWVFIM